jgi:hypothetical protein
MPLTLPPRGSLPLPASGERARVRGLCAEGVYAWAPW